jgi:hypothetical protein
MATFEDHLYNGQYPYVTPEQFVDDKSACVLAQGMDPEEQIVLDAIMDASLALYYLTGKQFNGTKETTVRPYCDCLDCAPLRLTMGLWPVTSIIAVRENGVDQDPDAYHVDEYRYIVRNDGEAFPRCGNWWAEQGGSFDTEENGYVFSVTVEHGIPAPPLLKRATIALACSLLASSIDTDCEDCVYSDKITSISRLGVSFNMEDFTNLLTQGTGSTGIYAVELARKVFNPSGLQSPSFFWNPDLARGKRAYTNVSDGVS